MAALEHLDDSPAQQRRLRQSLLFGTGILLLFFLNSIVEFSNRPALVEGLSAAADGAFLALLAAGYALVPRIRLGAIALALSAAILVYSIVNLLLFPAALLRLVGLPLLAASIAVVYADGRRLRAISIAAWLAIVLMAGVASVAGAAGSPVDIGALVGISAITLLVLNQFHARTHDLLAQLRVGNAALSDAQASLEAQVAERTATLQAALGEIQTHADEQARLLAEVAQQRATIRDLVAPVLPVGVSTLAIPLVGLFDAQRLIELQEQALEAVERSAARRLLLDITGVPFVDRAVAEGLVGVVRAVRLMGADVVLAGIRPEVAQAIVGLGVDLADLHTVQTLQEAIAGSERV